MRDGADVLRSGDSLDLGVCRFVRLGDGGLGAGLLFPIAYYFVIFVAWHSGAFVCAVYRCC